MKKLLLLILIPLFIGCAGFFQQAGYTANQVYVGMSIDEFRSVGGSKAKLEAMESGYTVFRMHDYHPNYGTVIDTKFFYFDSNGKLYKVDGGEFKQRRYQVEIINN